MTPNIVSFLRTPSICHYSPSLFDRGLSLPKIVEMLVHRQIAEDHIPNFATDVRQCVMTVTVQCYWYMP